MTKLLSMLPLASQMAPNDYVGFTFFVGCMMYGDDGRFGLFLFVDEWI